MQNFLLSSKKKEKEKTYDVALVELALEVVDDIGI